MDTASIVAFGVMMVFYLLVGVLGLVMYILRSIGQMKMAQSCGLKYAWLAFVPYANVYQLGQLAEQNPSNGKKSWPWRHIALIGQIVTAVMAIVMVIVMLYSMIPIIEAGGEPTSYDILEMYAGLAGIALPLSLFSTVFSVALYIIYWKVFALFAPDTAVIFLVLTILLGEAATAICFFILRNKTPVNRPGAGDQTWL